MNAPGAVRALLFRLLAGGFFHLLVARFLAQFLGFGMLLVAAKLLAPGELGEIRLIQSYAVPFTLLALAGLHSALLKFCSERRPEAGRAAIFSRALRIGAVTATGSFALLALLARHGGLVSSDRLAFWLILYGLALPFAAFTEAAFCYLQAVRRMKEMAAAQATNRFALFALVVAVTWAWGFRGFLLGTVAAYAFGALVAFRFVRDAALAPPAPALPQGFASFAAMSLAANMISEIGNYGDLYVLDHFAADRVAVGHYAFAGLFVLAATQVSQIAQTIVLPRLSERATDPGWFPGAARRFQFMVCAGSAGVSLLVWGIAWAAIRLFHGAGYAAALAFLPPLLVKYVLYSSHAVLGAALFALGRAGLNLFTVALSTPLSLFLGWLLVTRCGVAGAAWAQAGAQAFVLASTLILFRAAVRRIPPRPGSA